jgi:dCTP deaminase
MIVNGLALLGAKPLSPMLATKEREHGVSYGLSEAGYDIRIKQEVRLSPDNRFSLASTVEKFTMPPHLVGVVHDKSTWARQALSVFNTVIEPGWEGYLTLELVYHGNGELVIPAGAGIAQVLFYYLIYEASYGQGKYQNQPDHPVEAKLV